MLESRYTSVREPALRCGNLERNHISSRLLDDDLQPTEPRVADELGLRVERAVVAAGDPHRDAVNMVYVEQVPMQMIGARLGFAIRVLDAAHQAVAARLR